MTDNARLPATEPSDHTDSDAPAAVKEPRLWQDDGWTAKVVKNEDDEGWAVEDRKSVV